MSIDIFEHRAKAFDYVFDAIVVTDAQGLIIDWNKGSERLYGYAKEEVVGQAVSMLHVPGDTEHITLEVISAVEKHGKWTGEIRMLHKDGHIGWIESMCVPIYDENSQMVGALGINRDITKRKKETERLEYLAHYDQLTQIPNRYVLLDRLAHLIKQSKRNNYKFSLIFIDVDKFKFINDTKGHLFGDKVLMEIALRLKKSIRNSDTVARFGGDEFVVLFENISHQNDVSLMVETLSKELEKALIIDDINIDVTCSIGVAIFPDDGDTIGTLMATADKAMYKTKY